MAIKRCRNDETACNARCWTEERTCSAASLPSGKVSTQSPWTTASDNRQNRYNRAGKGGRHGHACIHTCITCIWSLQICYGIIYGMGAKSLGEQMGVEENDAACYIESFKARYKGTHCCLILLFISPTHCFPDLNNVMNVCGTYRCTCSYCNCAFCCCWHLYQSCESCRWPITPLFHLTSTFPHRNITSMSCPVFQGLMLSSEKLWRTV